MKIEFQYLKIAGYVINSSISRHSLSLKLWTSSFSFTWHLPHECDPVQFSSVAWSYMTLYDTMDCRTPGLPLHHQLLEFAKTHLHWVGDAIQPSHSLLSPLAFNLSQHRGLFEWVSSSHQVAKGLEFQLQHRSFERIFRTDFLDWLVWSPFCPRDSQESFPTPQFKSIHSSAFSFLHSPTLTSIHDHRKNHSLD